MPANPGPSPPASRLWLHRAEQATAAGVLAMAFMAMTGFVVWQNTTGQGVVDIDTAEPLPLNFLVDVNAADWPELTMLPEVGETLAQRIVEYREEHGPFRDHNELRRVRGVGPKTLEEIKPYLLPLADTRNVAGR